MFRQICKLFLILVASPAAATPAAAEIMVADSIEWRVFSADAIMRAKVESVDTQTGAEGLVIETAQLAVVETLKGTAPEKLTYSARLYRAAGWEVFDRPSRWHTDEVELLVFAKQGKIQSLLRLDGQLSHGQGYRAFTTDMKLCKTRNSILAAVYAAMAFEEIEQPLDAIRLEVPVGVEFWSEVYGGSAVYLVAPIDSRLEALVERWKELDASSLNGSSLKQQAPHVLAEIEKARKAAASKGGVSD